MKAISVYIRRLIWADQSYMSRIVARTKYFFVEKLQILPLIPMNKTGKHFLNEILMKYGCIKNTGSNYYGLIILWFNNIRCID